MAQLKKYTLDQWRCLADGNIRRRTTDNVLERNALLDSVAAKCVELDNADGPPASVWHALSLVTNTTCHCARCEQERKTS